MFVIVPAQINVVRYCFAYVTDSHGHARRARHLQAEAIEAREEGIEKEGEGSEAEGQGEREAGGGKRS